MNRFSNQLNLKQSQSINLTPQLLEGLKLLQYNSYDLELAISDILSTNILLEKSTENDIEIEYDDREEQPEDPLFDYEQLSDEMECDMSWEDIDDDYSTSQNNDYSTPSSTASGQSSEFDILDITPSQDLSFKAQLLLTLKQHPFSQAERELVDLIINHLDENYFLDSSISELAKKYKIDEEQLSGVVEQIKYLPPVGVASQNIQECLITKLCACDTKEEEAINHTNAYKILNQYFKFLGKKNAVIIRRLRLTQQLFDDALEIIKKLSPYPDELSHSELSQPIKPDVFIINKMSVFMAVENIDTRHNININQEYAGLVDSCSGDNKIFLQSQLKMAKAFLSSLDYRQNTILRVANAIVMHQQDFFIHGYTAMRPLKLEDIATMLELSKSTISRTINGKYLSFNHELYEFKTFFATDITSENYDEVESDEIGGSSVSAKAIIQEHINSEDPQKPLSDTYLTQLLKEKNIEVSRRTVSKYREALGIKKAADRKKLNRK